MCVSRTEESVGFAYSHSHELMGELLSKYVYKGGYASQTCDSLQHERMNILRIAQCMAVEYI